MAKHFDHIVKYLLVVFCIGCLSINQAQALFFSAVKDQSTQLGFSSSSSNNSQQIPFDWVIAEVAPEEDYDTNISKNNYRNTFLNQPLATLKFSFEVIDYSCFPENNVVDQVRRPYFLLYHSWKIDLI